MSDPSASAPPPGFDRNVDQLLDVGARIIVGPDGADGKRSGAEHHE